jgi:hypothetical protein
MVDVRVCEPRGILVLSCGEGGVEEESARDETVSN